MTEWNPDAGLFPGRLPGSRDDREILGVSEFTQLIRKNLESAFQDVWIAGEISNVAQPNSGHVYFTLKDDKAQLSAVMWRSAVRLLKFEPRNGLAVLAHGDLAVYPPRGQYQLVIKRLLPQGMGALQLAFLQLKEKLEKEGLFGQERKRPIPFLPRRIGIVTSPTGAAIRDILKQLKNRCAEVDVFIYPAKVQGEGAAAEIVEGIHALNEFGVDVMIVGRGGGSIEDLWPFNEEAVARAIYSSKVPVISAVGHEVDVTISDLVADVRALTPTAAGEMIVPDCMDLIRQLNSRQDRLRNALLNRVNVARARFNAMAQATVLRKPMELVRMHQQTVDTHHEHLRRISAAWLALLNEKVNSSAGRLESLSPLKVLARGYSITMKPDGTVLRKTEDLSAGDRLRTRLREGVVFSTVERVEET